MALFEVNCFSGVLGEGVRFNVILPQRSTSGQIGIENKSADKYPVLYLLHGLSDDDTTWLRRTSIERYATEKGIAVVMPTTHRGWYLDSAKGNFYTFIGKELPMLVAEFFPSISTDREHTFIAGLSMGGYGALRFALSMPDKYAAAAALSGAFDINAPSRKAQLINEHVIESDQSGTENDVYYLAQRLHDRGENKPAIFMWCGTEDSLLNDNRRMRDLMKKCGYELQYSESSGNHSWKYWDEQIQKVLDWLPLD